jgi:hypothetical protein
MTPKERERLIVELAKLKHTGIPTAILDSLVALLTAYKPQK